jgi:hypothetical protein
VSGSFTAEEPEGIYLLPTTIYSITPPLTGDPTAQHRGVVMKALRILRLLQDDQANLSIQNGALDMLDLSSALLDLGMSEEAESACTWAANLYRTLVRGHANSFLPYLGTALYNLAVCRACVGDRNGLLVASQDCVTTYRILCEKETHQDYLICLARALGKLATALLDVRRSEEALAAAEESVTILENVTPELLEIELLVSSSSPGSGSEESNGEDEEMVDLGFAEEDEGARITSTRSACLAIILVSNFFLSLIVLQKSIAIPMHTMLQKRPWISFVLFQRNILDHSMGGLPIAFGILPIFC